MVVLYVVVYNRTTDKRHEAVSCRRTDGAAGSGGSQRQARQTRGEQRFFYT